MSQYLEPNPDAWTNIDHIVVVMLENRSFDCMLGWLYDEEDPPHGQHFEGLSDDIRNDLEVIDANGVSFVEQVYARRNGQPPRKGSYGVRVKAEYPTQWNLPAADPGEGFRDTNSQLFERWDVPNDYPPDPTMGGFVQNYQGSMVYGSSVFGDDPVNPRQIMAAYTPQQLPVLSGLAKAFAVCDHWHCSVPSQTWPNRAFAFAATSEGNVNNRPDWVIEGETIYDRLQDAIDGTGGSAPRTDLSWSIYSGTQHGEPFSLTKIMLSDAKQQRFAGNFKPIGDFYDDAEQGRLPSYSFLEPQFSGAGQNDQKPPSDVRPGEVFIARIYEALRTSPQWGKTLLVITYDEHGGCHDHVAPPQAKSPDGKVDAQFGFQFNRFGGRVPAVVVSPWIGEGTIARPSGYVPFDHTSIIASIRNCFDLGGPLTARDGAAPDLSALLTQKKARDDAPPMKAPDFDAAAVKEVETGLQREIGRILGQRLGEQQADDESMHDFIMRLSRANDALVASYDLTRIKGVGPAMRTALNRAGIFTIDELAALSDADIDALDEKIEVPFKKDAAELRAWVAEAKSMTTSGSTASTGSSSTDAPRSVAGAATSSAVAPVPLVAQGQPVSWWLAFKFDADRFPGKPKTADEREGIFGGTLEDYDDQASDAKKFSQAYCFASAKSPTLVQGPGAIGTTLQDPVGATFGQVYDGTYFYALWNDQFYDNPMKTEGAPHGHSKGMLAWNAAGEGFVMQVSTPSWPASGSRQHPRHSDGNTLGYIDDDDIEVSQHFFTLRLTKDDVVAVLEALVNARVVCDPSKPELVRNGGPQDVADLVAKLGKEPDNPAVTKATLSSGVVLISKPSTVEVPPWQLVSAQLGGVDLRVASWWAHPAIDSTRAGATPGCWDASLGTPGAVEIATSGTWEGKAIGLTGGSGPTHNHAKLGVSTGSGTTLSIFGDMNQQGALCEDCTDPPRKCSSSQNGRGGLFFVLEDETLHASLAGLLAGKSGPLASKTS